MAANGTAQAPIEVSEIPIVVGINFGNSYASIAVLNKDGNADCIANEDGERQIACAVSFHGEETYIGNQAKHQLVKNAQNTITGFRNILGKKFSEIPANKISSSAPVIQHPDIPEEPAYKVEVLQAAPAPLPASVAHTPAASTVATPRNEPTKVTRYLTVSEVTSIFLKSLIQSAEDFLGRKVQGTVISVPTWFDDIQRAALTKAAEDAGIKVLQLLEEAAAAAVTTTLNGTLPADRTQLIVDLGASRLELSLLSIRQGLAYALATSSDDSVGGDAIDDKLIRFFAKEFTKKTKTPLSVAPSTDKADQRAEAKLRLAVEHTKRTLSASPGAATCSVESLKDGLDYTGSINRLRFDMEVRSVYEKVLSSAKTLVASAGLDLHDVDEIVYVGGSASLPGLDSLLLQEFTEDVVTPFTEGIAVGGGIGDPTTLLSRGCVLQAKILATLGEGTEEEREVKKAFELGSKWTQAKTTTKTVGLLFPSAADEDAELGGKWVPVVLKETPLPCRRTIRFQVESDENKTGFEVWEVKELIKITKEKPPKFEDEEPVDEEDEEEEEEIERKDKVIEKENLLGAVLLELKAAKTQVEVQVIVDENGSIKIDTSEIGGEKVTTTIPAA